jgi:hypothetical protein
MQETSIGLLTREGGLRATFRPALNAAEYAELLNAVEHDGDTIAEMTELLTGLARGWDRQVMFDAC